MKTSPVHEFEDPLAAEGEDARRALTLLWLAGSAPLTAAPPDSLTNLRDRLLPDISAPARRRPWRTVVTLSGWAAAAACLAVLLWRDPAPFRPDTSTKPVVKNPPPRSSPSPRQTDKNPSAPVTEAGTVQPLTDPADLRRQLTELRAALAASHQDPPAPGTHRPVIRELRPPGSPQPVVGHDRVLDIIATALESDLNRRVPSRDNPREVVIESGWADWSSALPAGVTFRHRQFPVSRWEELGLLRSTGSSGQFFDPATGWLWSPEPDSTDYTGRPAPADVDRSRFAAAAVPAPAPGPAPAPAPALAREPEESTLTPAGYLITGTGGETIVALNGLPSIPEGSTLSISALSDSGDQLRFGVNSTTLTTTEGWNFSGLIPSGSGADFARGFSVELQNRSGSTVLLSSPSASGQ